MTLADDPTPLIIEKGRYKHSKTGNFYEVLGTALQTETQEQLVIYRPLYDSGYELFARPHSMFIENIEMNGKIIPRFQKVEETI